MVVSYSFLVCRRSYPESNNHKVKLVWGEHWCLG